MRRFVIVMGLVFCGLTNQPALAQDFWYVPSGYDSGYYYGFDLGNRVGYGYGLGIGIAIPVGSLTGSATADVQQAESTCCDEEVSRPISAVDSPIDKFFPVKSKSTAKLKPKKSETKAQKPKSMPETKTSKTPTQMKAHTVHAT